MPNIYYVDPDVGTGVGTVNDPSNPYKSYDDIVSIVSTDTVRWKRGTTDYPFNDTVNTSIALTAVDDITFEAYSDDETGADDDTTLAKPIISKLLDISADSWTEVQSDGTTEVVTPGDTNIWRSDTHNGSVAPTRCWIDGVGVKKVDDGDTHTSIDGDRMWYWGDVSGKVVFVYSTSVPTDVVIPIPGVATAVTFTDCENVAVSNIKIKGGVQTNLLYTATTNDISGLTVTNCVGESVGLNGKGIEIAGTDTTGNIKNVVIDSCVLDAKVTAGEDLWLITGNSLTVGGGGYEKPGSDGIRVRNNIGTSGVPNSGVLIQNCTVKNFGHDEIAIGNSGAGQDTIYGCLVEDVDLSCPDVNYGRGLGLNHAEGCVIRRYDIHDCKIRTQLAGTNNEMYSGVIRDQVAATSGDTENDELAEALHLGLSNTSDTCTGNKIYNCVFDNIPGFAFGVEIGGSSSVGMGSNTFSNIIIQNCGFSPLYEGTNHSKYTAIQFRQATGEPGASQSFADQTVENVIIWNDDGGVPVIKISEAGESPTASDFTIAEAIAKDNSEGNTPTHIFTTVTNEDPLLDSSYKPAKDSPARHAGTFIDITATDYNGRPFHKVNPDPTIGMYEYTSGFPAQTRSLAAARSEATARTAIGKARTLRNLARPTSASPAAVVSPPIPDTTYVPALTFNIYNNDTADALEVDTINTNNIDEPVLGMNATLSDAWGLHDVYDHVFVESTITGLTPYSWVPQGMYTTSGEILYGYLVHKAAKSIREKGIIIQYNLGTNALEKIYIIPQTIHGGGLVKSGDYIIISDSDNLYHYDIVNDTTAVPGSSIEFTVTLDSTTTLDDPYGTYDKSPDPPGGYSEIAYNTKVSSMGLADDHSSNAHIWIAHYQNSGSCWILGYPVAVSNKVTATAPVYAFELANVSPNTGEANAIQGLQVISASAASYTFLLSRSASTPLTFGSRLTKVVFEDRSGSFLPALPATSYTEVAVLPTGSEGLSWHSNNAYTWFEAGCEKYYNNSPNWLLSFPYIIKLNVTV